jgi:hypothetical protein
MNIYFQKRQIRNKEDDRVELPEREEKWNEGILDVSIPPSFENCESSVVAKI